LAVKTEDGSYRLYGYKWFTSATDSNMALTLGKIIPADRVPTEAELAKTQVSMFYVQMRNENSQLNNLEIVRLKDKLGTHQLPTAELLLKGTVAKLVGKPSQGVKNISKMLLVTRMYNSATAVGIMRRVIALARDYSSRRKIGNKKLSDMPLQRRVLSHMEVTHRANLIFYLSISILMSKHQAGTIK
jgi:alkylation response protein AidB-like acyl-CoA dehydrogenase